MDSPKSGVKNFNPKMPLEGGGWVFNDNGNQMVDIWDDASFKVIDMKNGELFCEYIFTYKSELAKGDSSVLSWGKTYEVVDGRLVKGMTEIYDESVGSIILTMINGSLRNKK
jgi:hypothetical protein